MITAMQRKELEKIKPPKYRERVREYLVEKGEIFSIETIQKVYSGKRNNLIIEKAIISVFGNYMEEKKLIDSSIDKVIDQINKGIP